MKIQSTNYITPKNTFRAQKQEKVKQSPLKNSIKTAGLWFGFGIALDLVSRNVCFSKSPMKNSLAINSIIASTAGIVTLLTTAGKNKKV